MMKKTRKPVLSIFIVLLVFIAIVGAVLINASTNIPEAISTEQMSDMLVEKGFNPTSAVNNADENLLKAGLDNCIIAEQDDIKIEFYDFNNNDEALKTYRKAYSLIIRTKMGFPRIQIKREKFSYKLYTLDSEGTYSVAIYVKNTAIYAYCNSENKYSLNELLAEIGYVNVEKR